MKGMKVEPKRRAGLPPREKPKPVTPAFGRASETEYCTGCDIGCEEPVQAACAPRDAAGGNGQRKRGRKAPTGTVAAADGIGRRFEKIAEDRRGKAPVDPPPVKRHGLQAIPTYLDPALIDPSPYQVRREFPADEIRALADSIAAEGLISPITVRPKGKRYELLAGERRLRAVRLLKSLGGGIRAEIQNRSDAEARAIVLAENLQRKDLNAIEQARAFKAILDAGDYRTQEDLAKALGISQGQVSNTIRLLELPAALQKRVISAEITVGQARAILPYTGHPKLLAAIDQEIDHILKNQARGLEPLPPAEQFGWVVAEAARRIGRPIYDRGDWHWDSKSGRRVTAFCPGDGLREELEIVEVNEYFEIPGSRPSRFALNRKRYDALEAEHRKREIAAGDGKGKAGAGKITKAKVQAAAIPPRKLSAAERKQAEEADRKRDAARRAEQARLTARRVHVWRINRLREAVAAALRDPATKGVKVEESKIAIWLIVAASGWHLHGAAAGSHAHDREHIFRAAFGLGGSARKTWPAIAALDAAAIAAGVPELLARLVWPATDRLPIPIPDDVVIGMAEVCRVDLAALWKTDQKEAAGKAYYELHTREQLVTLGGELGVYLKETLDKAAMVRALTSRGTILALPRELGGKGKRKPATR